MAGFQVTRDLLDQRSAGAVLAVRSAFDIVGAISAFLATVPADAPEGDRLTMPQVHNVDGTTDDGFGYTEEEAYLIRVTFQTLREAYDTLAPTLEVARRLTGLSTIGG